MPKLPELDALIRCPRQACWRHDEPFRFSGGFRCPRGETERCYILDPPPAIPLWRRRGFRRSVSAFVAILLVFGFFLAREAYLAAKRPRLIGQSQSEQMQLGGPWEAYIEVRGEEPLTYQWYRGFRGDTSHPLSGETSPKLRLAELTGPYVVWVRTFNAYGSIDSNHFVIDPVVVAKINYPRELYELYSQARTVLEQTDSIRVTRKTLESSHSMLTPDEIRQYQQQLKIAERKRLEAAYAYLAKLDYLFTLDRSVVTGLLNRSASESREGVEGERRARTLELMVRHWTSRLQSHSVTMEDVLADAEKTKRF